MKNSVILTFVTRMVAVTTVTLFLFSGCQGGGKVEVRSTPDQVGNYTGQQLPDKVEKLVGTPFYSTAKELAGVAKLQGASYLVIAPQAPTNAVLVLEKMSKVEDVAARPSTMSEFSGKTTTVAAPELVTYVKEHYELDLNVAADGKVTVLELSQAPSAGASPTPQPAEGDKGE